VTRGGGDENDEVRMRRDDEVRDDDAKSSTLGFPYT